MKVIVKSVKDYPEAVRFEILKLKNVGDFMVAVDDDGLCFTGMTAEIKRVQKQFPKSVLIRDKELQKLKPAMEKFWQDQKVFPLPFVLRGTAFQIKIWRALLKIKKGEVISYQALAQKIGHPKAVRAVGSAVGKNPLTLLIPCHRVLAQNKNAKLKFGWGPEAKEKLLKAEGVL